VVTLSLVTVRTLQSNEGVDFFYSSDFRVLKTEFGMVTAFRVFGAQKLKKSQNMARNCFFFEWSNMDVKNP
jgi:hypothetical protein